MANNRELSQFASTVGYSGGNIGIGTAVPEDELHIFLDSSGDGPSLRLTNPNGGDGTYTGRISTGDAAGTFFAGINFLKHDTNDGEIRLRTKVAGTNTDVLTVVDGNIGIGSDNPQKKLDVAGDVKILDNSPRLEFHDANSSSLSNTTGGFETFDKSGNRATYVGAGMANGGNIIEFGTNNTFRAIIDSSGNFGIGENSPDRLLHIKGASSTAYSGGSDTADYNFLKIENTTNDKSAGIFFQIGGNGEAAITATEVADGNTDISFQNRGGGARSEKVRITSGGSVGFNTTLTQSSKTIHIAGDYSSVTQNVAGEGLIFQSFTTASTGDVYPGISWTGNPGALGRARASINAIATNDNNGSDIVFLTRNAADGTELDVTDDEKVRITSAGRVGIGTEIPNHGLSLHQSGTGTFDAINIITGNTNSTGYQMGINSSGEVFHWNTTNSSINFATNNTERLRINSSGQVSLGGEPSSGAGLLNVKPSSGDEYLKIRDAGDFNASLNGVALDTRNSANTASKDLVIRSLSLVLWQNTTERLRIDSGGQIGINENNPAERIHMAGAIRQDGANNNVQVHQACFAFSSGATHTIYTLSGYGNDATAIAVFEYVCLYAYAGTNHEAGIIYASTRRTNNNTAWNDIDNIAADQAGNDSNIRPNLFWDNGVLKITVGSSVQCTGTLRLTTRQFTVTRNYSAG